jgi:hypothetical protein
VVEGRQILRRLVEEQGEDVEEYSYGNCLIKKSALVRGISIYDIAIRLFIHSVLQKNEGALSSSEPVADGEWVDMCGMLTPKCEIDRLESDIASGAIGGTDEIVSILKLIQCDYHKNALAYAVSLIAIKFLMDFVKKHTFSAFGWYRIALGGVVFVLAVTVL